MKPFLKWAGGKSRLAGHIDKLLPRTDGRLIEPFLGSGSVFLGMAEFKGYVLGDANPDLITLYETLKDKFTADILIRAVNDLFKPRNCNRASYNAFRDEFNAPGGDEIRRSALFVYLNKHAFNGLYRVNSKGHFNVPFAQYDEKRSPTAPAAEMAGFSERARNATFMNKDFRIVLDEAGKDDVVYCDPPYVSLDHSPACFASYAKDKFSWKDQEDLAEICSKLALNGTPALISNHDTVDIRRVYERLGAEVTTMGVRRSVGASAVTRQKVNEVFAMFHVPGSEGYREWQDRIKRGIRLGDVVADISQLATDTAGRAVEDAAFKDVSRQHELALADA